jgi:hypothetical protein
MKNDLKGGSFRDIDLLPERQLPEGIVKNGGTGNVMLIGTKKDFPRAHP